MAEDRRMTAAQVVDKVMGSEHVDVVRESVAWLVGELMEAEVAAQIGAELGEVSSERVTHRNGYRPRPWQTRAGEIELAIPKLRSGSYFPSVLEPRKRSEQALVAVVQEAYVNGVSTRKSTGWSSSSVSPGSARTPSRGSAAASMGRCGCSVSGRWRVATRMCGLTARSRRSETAARCARSAS
jgi:Transposase, Mutator family